jgi:oligosaccharide repeat unit polymerase
MNLTKLIPNVTLAIFGLVFLVAAKTSSERQIFTILAFFLSALLLKVYMMRQSAAVDMVVVFYVTFLVTVGFGALAFTYNSDFLLHSFLGGLRLGQALEWYAVCMSLGLLVFIAMSLVLTISETFRVKKTPRLAQKTESVVAVCFFGAVAITLLGMVLEPGYIASVREVFSGSMSGGALRKSITLSDSGGSFAGKSLVTLVKYQILPFLSLIMLVNCRSKKLGIFWVCLISLILIGSEFRRAPVFFYVISLAVIYVKFSTREVVGLKVYLYGLAIVSAAMILMTAALGRGGVSSDTGLFVFELAYRLFISQSQTGTYVFQIIPSLQPFLEGSGYIDNLPSFIAQKDTVSFAGQVFERVHGRDGGASFSSLVEGYANFGISGIFLVAIVLALIFFMIEIRRKRMAHDNLEVCLYIYILVAVAPGFAMGSIVGPLLNIVILYVGVFGMRCLALLVSEFRYKNMVSKRDIS